MFGYVVCKKSELSKEDGARYQSVYCGLCKSLERQFGQIERMSVNYDMTFLALLLSSLYEPSEETSVFRCGFHITEKRTQTRNEWIDYAADMTVALAYFKCLDDWKDEKKRSRLQYGRKLVGAYRLVQERYPRQCRCIEMGLMELARIEENPEYLPDEAINCSGRIVAEIFAARTDFWSNSLRKIGYDLGRFIYLMDAVMDYDKDLKSGNYNPVVRMNRKPQDMEMYLNMLIGSATAEIEKLPLLQDEAILHNVLYEGVWQKYAAKYHKPEKKKQSTGSEKKKESKR